MNIKISLTQDEVGVIIAEHIRREHNLGRATIRLTWNREPMNCFIDVTDEDSPRIKTSVFTDDDNSYLNEADEA